MGMYGGTIEWFLKHIMNQSMDIQEMNHRAAALETGSGGVQFYPNLAGERTPFWNPLFTGTVTGMRQEHRAEHLFRAIIGSQRVYNEENYGNRGGIRYRF